MADRITAIAVWDTLECDGGSEQAVLPIPFTAIATYDLSGAERLTVDVDHTDASYAEVSHERVIRLTFADADVQEWRIREIDAERHNDNARTSRLTCESIRFDLIHNSGVLERVEINGQVKNHFELYGLTPTQHVGIILGEAPAYFAAGTIHDIATPLEYTKIDGVVSIIRTRVDMIYHQDSPLSALMELAAVSKLELEVVRNGATNYLVNLIQSRGDGAALRTVEHAVDLLSQRRRTLSSDMGTVVYPRGGQDYGNEGSMEGHLFLAAGVSGSTVTFRDDLFSEDDQLNGYFVEDSAGAIIEITDTTAPATITLASAPSTALHSYFRFRRAITTAAGTVYGSLTFLPSPSAIAQYGKKPATLLRNDIPLIDNLVVNPFMQDDSWSGDMPHGYGLVGSPTVLKNTDPLYTRHGAASWHVMASGEGTGVETLPFRVFPTIQAPWLTAQVQIYVVSGHIRLELVDATNNVVYPLLEQDKPVTIAENVWIDNFGVAPGGEPDDNFFTRGTTHAKIRLTQTGDGPCEFYWDAALLTHRPTFTDRDVFYGGRASNDLWLLAREALEQLITPSAEYDVETIDEFRLSGAGTPIVLGGDVRMLDTEMAIDFTTRILKVEPDYLHEGLTKIQVEGKSNDLTRIQSQTDRRTRRELGPSHEVGTEDDLPPDSTDNLLECCIEAEGEYCSPDTAGDWEDNPVCDILLDATVGASVGTQISWAADQKLTVTGGAGDSGEANAAGTLKKTANGALLIDPLSSTTNVNVLTGSVSIENGQLRIEADTRVQFTGYSAQSTLVVQVTITADTGIHNGHHVIARMTGSLDGYSVRRSSFADTMWRVDGGFLFGPSLDDEFVPGGYPPFNVATYKISVADGVQRGRIGSVATPQTYEFTATDTAHDGTTGTAGLLFPGTEAGRHLVRNLVVCPNDDLTVTGMEAGYKVRVGSLVAVESGGTAVLDMAGTLYPATTVEILDASDNVVASLSPASGIYGGDVFEYDIDGLLEDESEFGVIGRVDLDFLDGSAALIETAVGQSVTSPAYVRRGGTTTIPAGTAIIRVMMRRIGATQAIFCATRFMINTGPVAAPWVPCELAPGGAQDVHVVPTDELKVMDLRFTDKYPKIDSTTNTSGPGTPKADTDGTIALSRRVFDSTVHKLHHKIETDSDWGVGPNGDDGLNPDGDFVGDWPEPVPGTRGWGLKTKSWGNYFDYYPELDAQNIRPSGIIVYDAPDVASIRGPEGEYNKMHGFTYFFWWQPAIETFWDHTLAGVYKTTQNVEDNLDLGEVFVRERAGWRFVYTYDPFGSNEYAHALWVALELEDNFYAVVFESHDGGACDPFFGEAADTALHNIGRYATIPAFLALRFSEQSAGGAPTSISHGHTGAGGSSVFVDGATDYAQSFVAPETGSISHVTLTMRQGDAANYSPNTNDPWINDTLRVRVHVVPDSGGAPGVWPAGTPQYGSVAAAAMPTSSESPAPMTASLAYSAPVVQGQTYWIVVEGRHADDAAGSVFGIDGSHRIEVFGTDPGDDAGGSAVSGAHPGSWSAATIDLDYAVAGTELDGDTITVDVWLGNPRTGNLKKMGAAELSSDRGIAPGSPAGYLNNTAVPVPRAFTAEDNSTQPTVGAFTQNRDDSLELRITWFGGAAGILSAAVRHNRACTDVEVLGAFVAGYRHEYEAACSIHEPDVDNTGEGAERVTPCGGEGGGEAVTDYVQLEE